MSIRFLLDENLRGPLWQAILRHNLSGAPAVDVVRVGDATEIPLGADDPSIIVWAERENRILVTEDSRTIPLHLQHHLTAGGHSPGVLMVRRNARIRELVETLVLIAHAGDPHDFADSIVYIP